MNAIAIAENRRTFSMWNGIVLSFISLCALSLLEVPVNIITEGQRWIVVVERLGIEMEVALRVVGCAFISARSR